MQPLVLSTKNSETYNPASRFLIRNVYKFSGKAYHVAIPLISIAAGVLASATLKSVTEVIKTPFLIFAGGAIASVAVAIMYGKRLLNKLDEQSSVFRKARMGCEEKKNYREALKCAQQNNRLFEQAGLSNPEAQSVERIYENFLLSNCAQLYLCDDKDQADEDLKELIRQTGLPVKDSESAVIKTQFPLPKDPKKEDLDKFEDKRETLLPLISRLGFRETVLPSFKTYGSVVFTAAAPSTMQRQVEFVIEQWNQGLRFEKVYFLVEDQKTAEELWKRAKKPIEMEALPVVYSEKKGNGLNYEEMIKQRREQLDLLSLVQNHLFIAAAPSIPRQDYAARFLMKKLLNFETAGPELPNYTIRQYMHEMYRYWVFRETYKLP